MEKQNKTMPKGKKYLSQGALLLCTALWGASFIFTRDLFLTTPHVTALVIITGRMLFATLCFLPYMLATRRLPRLRGKDLGFFLILALLEPFLYSLCETNALALVSGSLTSIIIALIPLFVPFAMALVFKERLYAREVWGVVISLVGIALLIIGPGFTLVASPKGLLLLGGAVVVAITYVLVLSRAVNRYHPFVITCYQNLIALCYFLPLLLWREHDVLTQIVYTPRMIGDIAFLGIFCSTVAYISFNYGMRAEGASRASAYNNLIPVFSLLVALLIGQETLTVTKALGMAVVIVGLFFAQSGERKDAV